jgi:hypothetical protein
MNEILSVERGRAQQTVRSAYDHIRAGSFEIGWKEYEARLLANNDRRNLPQPPWQGEDLQGKSILVHREQGVGDEIWFAACFSDLLSIAGRCILTCDVRLDSLYRRSFPTATILENRPGAEELQQWREAQVDFQVPAGSLFRVFRPAESSFPDRNGYLVAAEDRVRVWKARLDELGAGPKVGISWQGGATSRVPLRQAPWEVWHSILSVDGVTFVNLQYGDCRPILDVIRDQWGIVVHNWPEADPLSDLDSQAALITALDGVIAVPNTVVHLAGALGKPVILPFSSSWGCFWILGGMRCPWYPTVTVVPKTLSGWTGVTENVMNILAEWRHRIGAGGGRTSRISRTAGSNAREKHYEY